MRPLFRYVMLKTARDQFITPLMFSPVAMINAPVVGLLVRALVTKRPVYPFVLAGESPEQSLTILAYFGAGLCAVAGGAAAFWVFRQEIIDRSVAAIVMAARPLAVAVSAVLYGMAVATLSFAVSMATLSLLTLSVPDNLPLFFMRVIGSSLLVSALAVVCVAKSPDPGMLLPMLIIGVPFTVAIHEGSVTAMAIAAATILALPLLGSFLLERRCAG